MAGRDGLLGTTGIWAPTASGTWQRIPAPPLVERQRITLTGTSRAALAREYLVLASGAVGAARHRRLDALERLFSLFLEARPTDRPAGLRRLPRPAEIVRQNRRLAAQLDRAAEVAHRLVDFDGDVPALADALTTSRPPWRVPARRRDAYASHVAPFLPTIHLMLPLVARRMDGFPERWPELAPPAIPAALLEAVLVGDQPAVGGLIMDDRWIIAAVDASERWRELLIQRVPALEPVLIEVRASWVE